jgi:bifunctional non-homologous end joining protein LigD
MLATLIQAPFDDQDWVFETKWDGFRVVATTGGGQATLWSRNGKSVTRDYPTIAAALAKIRHRAVLDGELVALDARGRSRFQLLQNARRSKVRLHYCVFDLMSLDGSDLRKLPLLERKRLLRSLLPASGPIRFSRHIRTKGRALFRAAMRRGLEGIMAKRAQGHYFSGQRTREWLKIKVTRRQEAVIVGFTQPRRSRQYFGALVLAQREGKSWHYAGHTGTGFSVADLKSIHEKLIALATKSSPFRAPIPHEAVTTWIKPKLVCEVDFTEWTTSGQMRHPAFVGLRTDKPATQVVRERAKSAAPRRRTRTRA